MDRYINGSTAYQTYWDIFHCWLENACVDRNKTIITKTLKSLLSQNLSLRILSSFSFSSFPSSSFLTSSLSSFSSLNSTKKIQYEQFFGLKHF